MTIATLPNGLASLAGRLTDPQDRETYAGLVSYLNRLPPTDEFRKLAEWFGLLSLLGQRVPEALAEFLAELRKQTKASADYHAQVDARLARLPEEITSSVEAGAIAKAMSEAFRQQLAATGLQDSAASLDSAAKTIKALSGEISASLRPAAQEFKVIASTISSEVARLAAASRLVEDHNARLMASERETGRWWQGFFALLLFVLGGLAGILLEKNQTTDAMGSVAAQLERIQTPAGTPTAVAPRKKGK